MKLNGVALEPDHTWQKNSSHAICHPTIIIKLKGSNHEKNQNENLYALHP
jgi:hypothetical protein